MYICNIYLFIYKPTQLLNVPMRNNYFSEYADFSQILM